MKKFFIALTIMFAVSMSTYAVKVTTSCGTQYEVTCGSCSTSTIVAVAIALDAQDC